MRLAPVSKVGVYGEVKAVLLLKFILVTLLLVLAIGLFMRKLTRFLGKPVEIEPKVECSKQLGRDFFSGASTIFAIFNQSSKV